MSKTLVPFTARQGDVLVIQTSESAIPTDVQKVEREGSLVILAHGEVTGHSHHIAEADVELFRSTSEAIDSWLRVGSGGANLKHQEHSTITLPPGTYKVKRQVEYTPEAIVRVAD